MDIICEKRLIEMNVKQKQSQDSQRKFMLSALEMINEKGYSEITVQDICTRAEKSIGAFYHHFSSKEDVIIAAYKDFDKKLQDSYRFDDFPDWTNALSFLLDSYLKYSSDNGFEFSKATIIAQLSIENPYLTDSNRTFYHSVAEALENGIAHGDIPMSHNAEELCHWFIRTVRGTIFDWVLRRGEPSLLEMGKKDYSVILCMLKQQKNSD